MIIASSVVIFSVLQHLGRSVCAEDANMQVLSEVIGKIPNYAVIRFRKREAKDEEPGMEASEELDRIQTQESLLDPFAHLQRVLHLVQDLADQDGTDRG